MLFARMSPNISYTIIAELPFTRLLETGCPHQITRVSHDPTPVQVSSPHRKRQQAFLRMLARAVCSALPCAVRSALLA
eukprot:13453414-Alexandrium_andersonii.AAC.1